MNYLCLSYAGKSSIEVVDKLSAEVAPVKDGEQHGGTKSLHEHTARASAGRITRTHFETTREGYFSIPARQLTS
jgi:hypothetical protein